AYEAQARAVTQLGVECIGLAGLAGDVEALLLLAESLDATGLKTDRHDISSQGSYTIALCTVGVLQAILAACVSAGFTDLNWQWAVLAAWHRSDLVAVDALMDKPSIDQQYGSAISTLARLQGGLEAIDSCRALLPTQQAATADSSNGPALSADLARCSEELDRLEQTFRLVQELRPDVGWLVDFSLMGSFDYYTGLMFSAFAPGSGYPLAGGGRYDQTLSQFGAPAPATGFALNLERIVSAILSEGAAVSQSTTGSAPRRIVADPQDPARAFREANEFRTRGQVAAITEEEA
ncbi:MAG: ATP phosphoribosyltransferase regulatory subunit, partial [Coriobacteriia bacterium]|nr:ATP phosphoribosyltransferase regulatory subunit [Coriobacteriia bacterium]